MKNKKLIWNLINLLNGVLLLVYMAKSLHWFVILTPIKFYHFILLAAFIYGIRSWFESKHNVDNLVKSNKTTRTIYYLGGGVFILGFLFQLMHWPFAVLFQFIGVGAVVGSFIVSFFKNGDNEKESNPNILDDI